MKDRKLSSVNIDVTLYFNNIKEIIKKHNQLYIKCLSFKIGMQLLRSPKK